MIKLEFLIPTVNTPFLKFKPGSVGPFASSRAALLPRSSGQSEYSQKGLLLDFYPILLTSAELHGPSRTYGLNKLYH